MTSAVFASFLNTAKPSGSFKFKDRDRLFRWRFWKSEFSLAPPICSPPVKFSGISTLMTLAPQSANWRTHVGPERTRVRSKTVNRLSAAEAKGMGIIWSFSFVEFCHNLDGFGWRVNVAIKWVIRFICSDPPFDLGQNFFEQKTAMKKIR